MGKSGRIGARLIYVQANDRRLRLSGSMDDKGVTGTGGVVAAAVLVPVVRFFVTGTSAAIPPESNTTGFLEEDVPVAFASAPAPMVVQPAVAAPVAAPQATVADGGAYRQGDPSGGYRRDAAIIGQCRVPLVLLHQVAERHPARAIL